MNNKVKREFYLFGLFRDMSSSDRSWAIFAFLVSFIIISTVSINIYSNMNHDKLISESKDCSTKVLLLNERVEDTRRLLYACKGILLNETCEEKILTPYNLRNKSSKYLQKVLFACKSNEQDALRAISKEAD